MRHVGETTELQGRRSGEDTLPIAPKSLRASDSEEWTWMVDEDPAFYLSRPVSREATGA